MAERKSIKSIDLGTNYLFARVSIKKKDPSKTNKLDIVKHAKVGEKVLTMPSGVAYECFFMYVCFLVMTPRRKTIFCLIRHPNKTTRFGLHWSNPPILPTLTPPPPNAAGAAIQSSQRHPPAAGCQLCVT